MLQELELRRQVSSDSPRHLVFLFFRIQLQLRTCSPLHKDLVVCRMSSSSPPIGQAVFKDATIDAFRYQDKRHAQRCDFAIARLAAKGG